ncbi:apolipoprotein N-acyltransferase [Nitrogeniibacter mangrovi]|uniref:Apolipoprotein N-acyltransferase n=1 Tax=Nitrogeniibacter mangrovi TaxID=2016596 RepID=A0A6C1B8Z2_9RHOO|nr:apolipoprotein N-acyltransferase [Nitrogeniibacter mangrovi]QID18810.1 apolipoprotein N-acyltransferase [Nitrogeniibacter mangrovi]
MRLRHLILAMLAGAATVLGFAPFLLFPLPLVTLAVLFGLLAGCRRAGEGFALGLAWGLGCFVAGISWLYVALHRFGGMPGPIAAACIFLFAAYLALWPALSAMAFVRLRAHRAWRDALLAGGVWVLGEWLRGWVFTGFPWLSIANSQTPPSPLAGFFPLVGVYGVGALLAMLAAGLGLMLRKGPGRLGPWCIATVLILGSGQALRSVRYTEPAGAPLRVALIQTNVEQDLKWQPERLRQWLDLNLQLVREHPADLVVLPESTLPMLADRLPPGYLEQLGAAAGGGTVVAGVFMRDTAEHIYNAAVSLGARPGQHYAKHHLVPFGEYSPPTFGWFYRLAKIPMSDQTAGAADQPMMAVADQRLALNICYEDVFGNQIRRRAGDATVLVNLSNLAWYGDSFAQPQHLQMARVRAIETGRPMLRATNTGMTAAIAPDGTVAAVLPAFTRDVLETQVQGMTGTTPYMRWGDALALALAGLMVVPSALRRGRRRRSST